MRTVNTHICEICGFASEDRKAVRACESQGRKNAFSGDQEVEYRLVYRPDPFANPKEIREQWVKVKIKRIIFQIRTHKALYIIGGIIDKRVAAKIEPIMNWESMQADENELRAVCAQAVKR